MFGISLPDYGVPNNTARTYVSAKSRSYLWFHGWNSWNCRKCHWLKFVIDLVYYVCVLYLRRGNRACARKFFYTSTSVIAYMNKTFWGATTMELWRREDFESISSTQSADLRLVRSHDLDCRRWRRSSLTLFVVEIFLVVVVWDVLGFVLTTDFLGAMMSRFMTSLTTE